MIDAFGRPEFFGLSELLALAVPSAIVPSERNYILNPTQRRFEKLLWDAQETITLDDRLWMVRA
jgi:RES domain-containing protein